jgi:hypothetical protein
LLATELTGALLEGVTRMARSRTRSPRTLVLQQSVPIEVTPLPFKPLAAIHHLDLEALSRAKSARIEVGSYDTGCCRRAVHAVVRKGMVTRFEVEPCKAPVKLTPEWKAVLRNVHKAVRAGSGKRQTFPIPAQQLPDAVARIKYSIWVCIKICCFGYCLTCCFDTTWVSSIWAKCSVMKAPNP